MQIQEIPTSMVRLGDDSLTITGSWVWNQFSTASDNYLQINDTISTMETNLRKSYCDYWDTYSGEVYVPPIPTTGFATSQAVSTGGATTQAVTSQNTGTVPQATTSQDQDASVAAQVKEAVFIFTSLFVLL